MIPENPEVWVTVSGENGPITVAIDGPHLYDLEIVRMAGDMADSFTLKVLDDTANELEYNLLSSSGGDISVKYRGSTISTGTSNTSYKNFNGYITKLSSSWIDDRNMLTLEGIIGISIQDKYEKISMGWNKVPKFDWGSAFSDYKSSGLAADRNEDDDLGESIGDYFSSLGNSFNSNTSYALNGIWSLITGDKDYFQGINASTLSFYSPFHSHHNMIMTEEFVPTVDGYEPLKNYLKEIVTNGWLKQDAAGNYYFPKMEYSNNIVKNQKKKDKNINKKYYVKQNGDYIMPMKPSDIVKMICKGGKFTDLIAKDEDFDDVYKGYEMYNGDATLSILDWVWIQVWYELMGSFEGLGFTNVDIEDTDMVEEDLSQNSQSYTEYISKTLIPVSAREVYEVTEDKSKVKVSKDKDWETHYYTRTRVVYTNFMFWVSGDNHAHYRRVSAKDIYKSGPITSYYYYGTPVSGSMPHNQNSYGILKSFSAKQDVLTALISNGIDAGEDISNIDIVYGGKHKDSKETVTPTDDKLKTFDGWGKVKVDYNGSSDTSRAIEVALANVHEEAEKLAYEAEATIIGTSNLNPLDLVEINIITKDRVNAGGMYKHHTSGNYLIQKITETISNSGIVSKLGLIKNANNLSSTNNGVKSSYVDKVFSKKVRTQQGKMKDIKAVEQYYMEVQRYYDRLGMKLTGEDWRNPTLTSGMKPGSWPIAPSDEVMSSYLDSSREEREKAYQEIIKEQYGYDTTTQCSAKNPNEVNAYNKAPAATFKESGIPTPSAITGLDYLEGISKEAGLTRKDQQ